MLAHDVAAVFEAAGHTVELASRTELDIVDAHAVTKAVAACDGVLNCAAYTQVDAAESDEQRAFAVNAIGPGNLARAAAERTKPIVSYSTDYVFSGTGTTPYEEHQLRAPVNAYGRTKTAGEWALHAEHPSPMILRTAWLYGKHTTGCFPHTMVRLVKERGGVQVITDQIGQPTWTRDVADLTLRLLTAGHTGGTYHATASGQTSWFEFAQTVVASAGLDPTLVTETTSAHFTTAATRPAYSVLGHNELTRRDIAPIGHWAARWHAAAEHVLH